MSLFKSQKDKKRLNVINNFNLNKLSIYNMLSSVHLEMKSNREVILEGCKSIEEYDENMIKVKVKKMTVIFFGRNLEIKCMNYDSLVIEGFITSIEFNT